MIKKFTKIFFPFCGGLFLWRPWGTGPAGPAPNPALPRQTPTEQVLSILHWLPIEHRIKYKMAVLRGLRTNWRGPYSLHAYLSELLHRHAPVRQTRWADKDLLVVSTMHTKIGSRAFSHAGPSVCNSLPEELKEKDSINSLKRRLKTNLFTSAHDC